ncbi:MAG TPA: NAD-glutamate dehydrogenase domain-containing protein, partial [Burkholderiaceae bacterium]|nr:NAD-glutamate dehydrogenase domain-containing protein [Burkholderiaceae bacterium]
CKVVAEGGNLGCTQFGRIEFAQKGGRICTDAIDNSAGVDCSDHEVNVKIWLDTEVNAGTLSEADRNRVLNDITQDIEVLVLRDNTRQTHLLVREEQAQHNAQVQDDYAALIASLEEEGVISRELEQLPSVTELARRKAEGRGLTAPELAVVIANVKNRYKRIMSALPLLQHNWSKSILTPYFPQGLVSTRDALAHPLANAILATVLANEAVNRCGPLMLTSMAHKHQVPESDVILAWAQSWAALNLAPLFATLDANALEIPCEESKSLDMRTRALEKAVIDGVLSVPAQQLNAGGGLAELMQMFSQPETARQLMALPAASKGSAFDDARRSVEAIEGMADFLFAALTVERPAGLSLPDFLKTGMGLRRRAGIDGLERTLTQLPITAQQEPLRGHALQSLRRTQQRLLTQVLQQLPKGAAPAVADGVVDTVIGKLKLNGRANADSTAASLEHAVLDVWALSEAAASSSITA